MADGGTEGQARGRARMDGGCGTRADLTRRHSRGVLADEGGLSAGRLAGMGVIYEVLRGLVLSRRVRRPFGDAEQQARATDSSDG